MSLKGYFKQEFTVNRTGSADGTWGNEGHVITTPPAFKGWLQPGSGKVVLRDGKPAGVSTHILLCPFGVNIMSFDKLVSGGKEYSVLTPYNAAGRNDHLEIDLEEVV